MSHVFTRETLGVNLDEAPPFKKSPAWIGPGCIWEEPGWALGIPAAKPSGEWTPWFCGTYGCL